MNCGLRVDGETAGARRAGTSGDPAADVSSLTRPDLPVRTAGAVHVVTLPRLWTDRPAYGAAVSGSGRTDSPRRVTEDAHPDPQA